MTDAEKPSGPISGLFYEYSTQLQAAGNHAIAEGHSVHARTVLHSYDRALHPWIHGRRPPDLYEALLDRINRLTSRLKRGGDGE